MSTITVSQSGTSAIDQLLSGQKWASANLTIAFPAASSDLGYAVSATDFAGLSASEKTAFKAVLSRWAEVSGLTFSEVSDPKTADISIYWYRAASNPTAQIAEPLDNSERAGDIQLGAGVSGGDLSSPGTFGYFAALQVIGEALGLKAPSASASGFPSSDAVYVYDSVMSQFSHAGAGLGTVAWGSYPQQPMANDIAAIQYLYGQNGGSSADTTYFFNPSSDVVLRPLVDVSGSDTFDFGSYSTNLTIDLRPGGWTDLGRQYAVLENGNPSVKPPGNIVMPLSGTVIENAYGGSGNDTIIGNASANQLRGGGGDDVLKPGAGNDFLIGGAGNDTFDFSDGAGGSKDIYDLQQGDVIKLRDVVVGGVIAQSNSGLTTGQVSHWTNGIVTMLYVGLDATPGADLSIYFEDAFLLSEFVVSGQTIRYIPDAAGPQVMSVTTAAGWNAAGAVLHFSVTFHEAVTVTGAPQLALTIGSTTRYANYASGSGSSSLDFTYVVQSDDLDTDGLSVNALGLNGGTLQDAGGHDASLTLNNVASMASVWVDGAGPVVTSVSTPYPTTYKPGDTLDFTVSFDEAVIVTGTPKLSVAIGSMVRQVDYVSGSGSTALVFRYTVQSGDSASSVTVGMLWEDNATLKDVAGNAADLTLNYVSPGGGVMVDGVAPVVSSVSVPTNAVYKAGDALTFTVNFDEAVNVTGTPQLALTVGSTTRQADYVSGSGTSALVFRYTLQSGETDADGITIGALGLNSGTVKDAAGNNASLTLNSVGATSSVLVDAVRPFANSVYVPDAGYYRTGETLTFSLDFSERVTVTGTAQLALTVGSTTRQADYVSGSSGTTLTFRYTIQAGDHAPSGIGVSGLTLNGGTLTDQAGNAASLTATGASSARVDMAPPVVTSVSVPAAGAYKVGDKLEFAVALDEAVTVTGTPQLALTVGSTIRQADYVSSSGSSTLVFRYTVQSGDADADGITVGALGLNGGTLKDWAGNDANLTLNSVGSTANVRVDTAGPTVSSASGPSAATYKVGDALDFTVNFSEAVTVSGAPKLALTLDTGGTLDATYVSGSGTSVLVFRYTVQAGNADTDGVTLGSSIVLNGGTLKDAGGNDAALTGVSVSGLANVKVDGVAPAVQSIDRVGAAVSKATSQSFTVTFGEAVTGVDASDFVVTATGTAAGAVTGVSGSGTTYTVTLGSVSGDGTVRLDLKGAGTGIADQAGNAISAGFAAGQSVTIDNTAPAAPTIAVVAGDDTISGGEVSGLTLSGAIEAGATVALTIGGVAKTASVSGTTWTYAVTQADIDALGAGAKTISVTASDALGNVSAAGARTVTIAADALTPEPEPEPEPTPAPTLVDLTARPASAFVALALGGLTITPGSSKTASATITLPDGSAAPSTAAKVQSDIDAALAAFKAGAISQAVFEQRLTLAVAPTTGVAHDAYKFFTGTTPSRAGMTWLIDAADNPNDLTDGYYARFTVENRYINFAVNLGKVGEGRASFEAKYGGLTFADAVAKAYGEIIGASEAQGAGVDVAAALRYIQGQEAYFRALGGDDLGAKAAMAGYVLSVGTSFHVGKYYAALEDYVVGAITAGASASAAAPAWDLG